MPATKKTFVRFFIDNSERISSIMGLTSVLVAFVALIIQFSNGNGISSGPAGRVLMGVSNEQAIQDLKAEIISIKSDQAKINSRIDGLTQIPGQTVSSVEITELKNTQSNLDNRFSRIENILVQDPLKSLEIPLMRKDLDNLVSTTDLQIALLRQDVERSYNLMLVTIVALAIAVLAPALSNIFKKSKDEKEKE